MTQWIYLPLDVKVRELEAKTFLAVRAALRGHLIVIGQKPKFKAVAACYPRGTYLGFAAIENGLEEYRAIAARGHKLILMDEEGLITHREEVYARNRLTPGVLELARHYIVWGDRHAALLEQHRPALRDKVIRSGNPRMDILAPAYHGAFHGRAEALRQKYGPYILINSNFGSSNHFNGRDAYFSSLIKNRMIGSQDDHDYFQSYFDYRSAVMDGIVAALPQLAREFPDHRLIVRPHPSENHKAWQSAVEPFPGAVVINEGSHIPWMMAADALIHNYCTTSVEHFMLGRTPVSYRPVIRNELEHPLPTQVSMVADNPDALIAAVRHVVSGAADPDRARKEADLALHLADHGERHAADVILDAVENGGQIPSGGKIVLPSLLYAARAAATRLRNKLPGRTENRYFKHKFPSLTKEELEELVHVYDPSGTVKVKQIDDMLFRLSA